VYYTEGDFIGYRYFDKYNGTVDGNKVDQSYVQHPSAADEPFGQLRGFQRTMIATEDSARVTFSLRRRDLSIWDVQAQEWAIMKGYYVFSAGASSRDLRVSKTVII